MGRYVNTIQIDNFNMDIIKNEVTEYMTKEGFKLVNYKGSKIWKKGMGIIMGPQYISFDYDYERAQVAIEAFVKWAILPGVYVGELGIEGFVGGGPKKKLRRHVNYIENYLFTVESND